MDIVFLCDDVNAMVPDEVESLMREIWKVTPTTKHADHVILALWHILLGEIMLSKKCTPQQASEHTQKLPKWTMWSPSY